MEKLRKYGSIAVVLVGLGLIFIYLYSHAPKESSVEFILPAGGVDASRIVLEYLKTEAGEEEPYRRVEKFPTASVSRIMDSPSLPEGDYVIRVTFWMRDRRKSFEKRYTHGTGEVTRFELNP
jgi:hypothetical protein